jgi:hypothetical protein
VGAGLQIAANLLRRRAAYAPEGRTRHELLTIANMIQTMVDKIKSIGERQNEKDNQS